MHFRSSSVPFIKRPSDYENGMDLSQVSRSRTMVDNSSLFEEILSQDNAASPSARCVLCKGSRMLCGKDRCSVVARVYSASRIRQRIDRNAIEGGRPPRVF